MALCSPIRITEATELSDCQPPHCVDHSQSEMYPTVYMFKTNMFISVFVLTYKHAYIYIMIMHMCITVCKGQAADIFTFLRLTQKQRAPQRRIHIKDHAQGFP